MESKFFSMNEFKVVGTLVDAKVTLGTRKSNGANYVSTDVVVSAEINGRHNEYEINFYANEMTSKNEISKLYTTYSTLGDLKGKKVEISGELRENRYWSTNNNQLVSAQLLAGKWVKGVLDSTPDEGTFTLGGFIAKTLTERTNKKGEVYRYDVSIGQPNYNGTKLNMYTLHVNPSATEIVKGVSAYNVGATVKLKGSLSFFVEQTVVTDENSAFGEPMTRTFTNRQKNFYIEAGSNPMTADQGAYDTMTITSLIEAYKANDAQLMANGASNAGSTPVTKEAPITKRQTSLI